MEGHSTPENPPFVYSAMPPAPDPISGNIPTSLECASCKYDLEGLFWGAPCPECGYRAPTTYPTNALREAHPGFIRSTRNQLRGMVLADATTIAGLASGVIAYGVAVVLYPGSDRAQVVWLLWLLGLVGIVVAMLAMIVIAGLMSRRHPYARADLDQPNRKGLTKAYWWCVGPIGAGLLLTIVSGGAAGCMLLIAIPISLAAAGVLAYSLFEHNTSIITRCRMDPAWTPAQSLLGYGSILFFVLFAVAIPVLPLATIPLVATGIVMLFVTHALRTRMAERCVRLVQDEIHEPHGPSATEADQPHEPPRS